MFRWSLSDLVIHRTQWVRCILGVGTWDNFVMETFCLVSIFLPYFVMLAVSLCLEVLRKIADWGHRGLESSILGILHQVLSIVECFQFEGNFKDHLFSMSLPSTRSGCFKPLPTWPWTLLDGTSTTSLGNLLLLQDYQKEVYVYNHLPLYLSIYSMRGLSCTAPTNPIPGVWLISDGKGSLHHGVWGQLGVLSEGDVIQRSSHRETRPG